MSIISEANLLLSVTSQAPVSVASQMREQAAWCLRLGSRLYARLLERASDDVEAGGPSWVVLKGHESDPHGSLLPLRLMGGAHRLALEGKAPALARHYPSAGGELGRDGAWEAFRDTIVEHCDALRSLVLNPVQTNEVGRAAALLGGFLLVARETGLPLRMLELGASAGLNLRWDHCRYENGGAVWGDAASPVRFANVFEGGLPFGVIPRVVERAGCDAVPLDAGTREGQLTLESHIWPDQIERLERMRAAFLVASRVPALVERADAADWVVGRLRQAGPGIATGGVATVVFNSIVMHYLSGERRDLVTRAIEEAGSRATERGPLAWLTMEAGEERAEVHLTLWPGGRRRLIATAGYHGWPVKWMAC